DDGHAVLDDGLARFTDLAVAATFGGQIDDHRTGRHSLHHIFGYQHRRFFSRNHRRRDHHIAFLYYFSQQLALTAVEVFILGAGISTSVLRVFRLDGKLDKTSAETLHLLLRRGPLVVGRNHRAEAPRGRDRLQSSNAAADHEHAGRCDGSSRGGEHGEKAWVGIGCHQHRLVSANGAHRGQRVHALGARGTGHQLHGKRGDASVRDLLHDVRRTEGTLKSDEGLIAAKQRHILLPGHVVGTVAKNLHDYVRGSKHGSAVRNDLRALVGILGIGIAGLDSSAGLYVNFETRFGQRREDYRHERNPPLPRISFFRHTDDHEALPIKRFCVAIEKIGAARLASILLLRATSKETTILVERRSARKRLPLQVLGVRCQVSGKSKKV